MNKNFVIGSKARVIHCNAGLVPVEDGQDCCICHLIGKKGIIKNIDDRRISMLIYDKIVTFSPEELKPSGKSTRKIKNK